MSQSLHIASSNIEKFVYDHLNEMKDEAFFVFDLEAERFIHLSPSFEIIWPLHPGDVLADPSIILKSVFEDDREMLVEKYKLFLNLPENNEVEFRIRIDNIERWVWLRTYPIKDESKTVKWIGGFVQDITDKINHVKYLLTINEKKDSTIAIVAHDLATPITLMQSLVNMLEKELTPKTSELSNNYLMLMQQVCRNSMNLIQDILSEEHLRSPEVVINRSRVNLNSKINIVLDTYNLAGKNSEREFRFFPTKDPIYAEVDEVKYMQVVQNLISNSMKFTKINGRIHIYLEEKENSVLLYVKDDGIGIPEKFQPHIFEKFSKARRPGLNGEKPVGLGLSIVKLLVELHNGKIWFESKENHGSTFYVEVPK